MSLGHFLMCSAQILDTYPALPSGMSIIIAIAMIAILSSTSLLMSKVAMLMRMRCPDGAPSHTISLFPLSVEPLSYHVIQTLQPVMASALGPLF